MRMKLRSMRRMIAELFFGEKEYDWNQLRLIPIFSLRAQPKRAFIFGGRYWVRTLPIRLTHHDRYL